MRIASFDIFDTLLVRLVARPSDLFQIVAEELRERGLIKFTPADFAKLRVAAEIKSREPHPHRETTFDEIYADLAKELSWDADQVATAKSIELAAERKWIRVPEAARRKLERAREEADRILFLSDMYLPREFLIQLLREAELWRDGDELIVSGEIKSSKASGTMFAHVREQLGEIESWRHLGDNEHSDIRMALKHAIDAEHFNECALTRYERAFFGVDLCRSKASGAIRFARLSAPESNPVIWNVATAVAGPMLFWFVVWVLEEATKRGIHRLYFISRDGQILLEIARRIIAKWNYPVEARYLYGSRQAWRPGAGDTLDDWFRNWALGIGTPTNLRSIFSRLEIDPPDSIPDFPNPDEPLSNERRFALWKIISDSEIRARVIAQRKHKREIARAYLAQEGLLEDVPLAIVDIGWFGAMQRSLDSILSDRKTPLIGFYFGTIIHPPKELGGDRIFPFWRDEVVGRPLDTMHYTFLERFTVATHGTVRGYSEANGKIVPDLETNAHESLLKWGAETLQAGILKSSDIFLEVFQRGEADPHEMLKCARRCFELFSENPTRDEATVFGKMPVQDQKNEISAPTLIPAMSEWQIFQALLDHRKRPAGWWREGTLRARRSPSLWLFFALRRVLRGR